MEYRQLGTSGLRVPALSFGTGTFGGKGPLFSAWGQSDAAEARRLIDLCLDAGVTLFDTADVYSSGASEEILGQAIRGKRDAVLISTKTGLPMGDGPQDWAHRGPGWCGRLRSRCAASAPTTSTSFSFTPSTHRPPPKKSWAPLRR